MSIVNYYEHIEDFDGVTPKPDKMPADVKRIISHCSFTYNRRYYFFSPSRKQIYRYYTDIDFAVLLESRKTSKTSFRYLLIPDIDDGTPNTPNKRDSINISDRFIKRIEGMNKLVLPKLK